VAGLTDQSVTATSAIRNPRGFYPADELGKVAVDGSTLDVTRDDGYGSYAVSTSWRDPVCGCTKDEALALVPRRLRYRCAQHKDRPYTNEQPFPFSADERRRADERAWDDLGDQLKVPTRYLGVSFETSNKTAVLTATEQFVDDEDMWGKCLVLLGPTGVGKTLAGFCALRRVAIWQCERACWWSIGALVRAFLHDARDKAFEQCVTSDFLFLDDIGRTYVKEGGLAEAMLEDLLVEREAEERRTLLTSNLTIPRLYEALGDRVADRLRGSWGVIVTAPSESLRRKRRLPR
jgi:IstB-like ATP binding protein